MKNYCFKLILLIFLTLLSSTNALVFSQTEDNSSFSIILAVDSSGSMKRTDPENLRYGASKLFIDMISSSDEVAVLEFASDVNVLTPIEAIKSIDDRLKIKNKLDNFRLNGNTRIDLAIEKAIELFKDSKLSNKAIILFTDGALDVDGSPSSFKSKEALDRLLSDTLQKLNNNNIQVYAIALSDESADDESKELQELVMSTLADKTNGLYLKTSSNTEIHRKFIEVLKHLTDPPQLYFTRGSDAIEFQIDNKIKRANIVIDKNGQNTKNLTLDDQDNSYVKSVNNVLTWSKSKNYDVITLLEKPKDGKWSIKSPDGVEKLGVKIFADTVYKVDLIEISGDRQAFKKMVISGQMLYKNTESSPFLPVSIDNIKLFAQIDTPESRSIIIPMSYTKDNVYKCDYVPQIEGIYSVKVFSKGEIERVSEPLIINIAPEPLDSPMITVDQSVYALGETIKVTVFIRDERTKLPEDFLILQVYKNSVLKETKVLKTIKKAQKIYASYKPKDLSEVGKYNFILNYFDSDGDLQEKQVITYVVGRVYIATDDINFGKLDSSGKADSELTIKSELELTTLPVKLDIKAVEVDLEELNPSDLKFSYEPEFNIKGKPLGRAFNLSLSRGVFGGLSGFFRSKTVNGNVQLVLYSAQNEVLSEKNLPITFKIGSKLEYNIIWVFIGIVLCFIAGLIYFYNKQFVKPYSDNLYGKLVCLEVPKGCKPLEISSWELKDYQKIFIGSLKLNEIQISALSPEHAIIFVKDSGKNRSIWIKSATKSSSVFLNDISIGNNEVELKPGDKINLLGFIFTLVKRC